MPTENKEDEPPDEPSDDRPVVSDSWSTRMLLRDEGTGTKKKRARGRDRLVSQNHIDG